MTRRALALPAALAAGLVVAGCGGIEQDTTPRSQPVADVRGQQRAAEQERAQMAARAAALPARPAGIVDVVAGAGATLARPAAEAATATGGVNVLLTSASDAAAIARFCAGQSDVLALTRPLDDEARSRCQANGISATTFDIAADAIVAGTRGDGDVGGDCLAIADLRDALRRGSTVTSWSGLGFDALPFSIAGPALGDPRLAVVGRRVFRDAIGLDREDARADYRARRSDAAIQAEIDGTRAFVEARTRETAELARLRQRSKSARLAAIQRADRAAERRALAEIEAANRRRARKRQSVADPAALARRNRAFVDRRKRAARRAAAARFDAPLKAQAAALHDRLVAQIRRGGTLGLVPWRQFSLAEGRIRALEVDPRSGSAEGRPPNCVFPGRDDVARGSYPLSFRHTFYVSTRTLRRTEVRRFLATTLERAPGFAIAAGIVDLPAASYAAEYRRVSSRRYVPTIAEELNIARTQDAAPATPVGTTGATGPQTTVRGTPQTPRRNAIPGVAAGG